MRTVVVVLAMMLGGGCSTRPIPLDSGSAGGASTGDDPGGSGQDPGSPSTTTTSANDTEVADGGTDAASTTGGDSNFIEPRDVTHPGFECDLHQQDCARGFKCVPIAAQSFWDGTACVPVVEEPLGFEEPCDLPDPATGDDACGFGQYCRRTGIEGIGECTGLCLLEDPDDEYSYYCEDREADPSILCQSCFCECIRACHPLEQDCAEGSGCYPTGDQWQCAPDASGDEGGQGSSCEFINQCDGGFACLGPDFVAECDSTSGCCTAFCDLDEEDPCPNQDLGASCVTWYEKGSAPPGYESVGVCILDVG